MHMEIDLVYLWVDGNDPVWQAKRSAVIDNSEVNSTNGKCRFANNDELMYSLRAVEMYAPWIRQIFIVTDNQVPSWLDTTNPKVHIVDHREIMPEESLPCFNSVLLEHFLHQIPGLSEYFLYANDDTFINKEVSPSDFFTPEGLPIIRLRRKPFRRIRWFLKKAVLRKSLDNFKVTLELASKIIKDKYGTYYTDVPHHNIDAYLKSDCKRVAEEVLREEFKADMTHHTRTDDDINRVVYAYISISEKRGILQHVTENISLCMGIYHKNYEDKLKKYNPMFFCLNDSEFATDDDRKRATAMLNKRFSEKSQFEK